MSSPKKIVDQMYDGDLFSQWLGIKRLEEKEGYCKLCLTVRPEMVNGLGIAHGGITYSMADTCLAFAANTHGKKSMSIETSISHTKPVQVGDVLTATAKEESLSNKVAIYNIEIVNQKDIKVALFKGTVYRTSDSW